MKNKGRVYIAGPMTGLRFLNFPAFDEAALRFRKAGYDAVNPAELDRVRGVHEYTDLGKDKHFGYRIAMKVDLTAICDCDAIALLPGWETSRGTAVELALAKLLKLKVLDAQTMKPIKVVL